MATLGETTAIGSGPAPFPRGGDRGRGGTRTVVAIDTSTDMLACAVGVVGEGGLLEVAASLDHVCRRQANVELVGCVGQALVRAGVARADVTDVVCGTGPGSFTGVRIGVAAAKGLACGLGVPLHAASTLDSVAWAAWAAGTRGLLGVVGDAMRREVYPGVYRLDDAGAHRLFASETVMKAPDAATLWAGRPDAGELTLTGDGLRKYREAYEGAGFARFLDEDLWRPSGEGLLRAWLARGGADPAHAPADSDEARNPQGDPALVLPVYTRLSDAEENERKRLGIAEPASVRVTGVDDALGDIHVQQRPMSVNDLPAVADLERRAFGEGTGHACWTREMFADEYEAPDSTWWVIHDQGRVIGFAGGRVIDGNLEVLDVAVDPSRRRQGLATRLLSRIAYDAQMLGARTSTLEVARDNDAARRLYELVGYEQVGVRRDYYGRGRDALTCKATLPLRIDVESDEPEPRPSERSWPPRRAPRDGAGLEALRAAGDLILAVESSCDETAMAVIDGAGRLRANVVSTQIDFHARFGGVVPEIASRKHVEAIVGVYEEAMAQAGESLGLQGPLEPTELAAVAVTQGPGLVGALVVGVSFAKALAFATDRPLVCVNHLEGHLYANLFETPDLMPPFVASLLSGGHTMLVLVRDWGDYRILGETLDDAVGEAFDKVAKALGLGYPGGPVISRLAKTGNPRAIDFPRAMLHSHDYRFSLSGLKTAVITYIHDENAAGRPINLPDLAASFEAAVIDVQVKKAAQAVREYGVRDFCAGGGVTANPELREAFERRFRRMGVRVTLPPTSACTDNAAMIALVAKGKLERGETSPLTVDADPNLELPGTRG
ncbi:MAG: tRNA (adenosine(37)-N6)-threonylcarbamoyltransferase complex transferase subunit TsaD [Coriobacteriales bacterium]|jgi:tRNA threonylcarbamoyl adenosine modification protein TsaD/tRNA threonylcarbamoyl adenosine modification protein YeaZ/ribosomal-protein-alanine acetyltransferase